MCFPLDVHVRGKVAMDVDLSWENLFFHQLIFHQNTYLIIISLSTWHLKWMSIKYNNCNKSTSGSNRNANWNAIIQQEIHTDPPLENNQRFMRAISNPLQQPICDSIFSNLQDATSAHTDLFTLTQYRYYERFHLCQIYNCPPDRTKGRPKWANNDKQDII